MLKDEKVEFHDAALNMRLIIETAKKLEKKPKEVESLLFEANPNWKNPYEKFLKKITTLSTKNLMINIRGEMKDYDV